MIELQAVSKYYDDQQILKDITLKIEKGDFVTVLGTSGSGKTTLMKTVNGLVPIESGTIRVNNEDISQLDQIQLRRRIGYSVQGNVLFPHLTVADNISYVLDISGEKDVAKIQKLSHYWLDKVGLSADLLLRYPDELSGGQQQRVGIIRSLIAEPEIVLMDEPFGAVDEITRLQLQEEIKSIHQETGTTVLFITHDVSEALRLGTKVLILDAGRIQQYDSPEKILKTPQNTYVQELIESANLCE